MDREATATATLTSEQFRQFPVVHGGLEIPYKVSVTMPRTVSNLLVLGKYWQLVDLYTETKNEEIFGSFLHAIVTDQGPPPAKKNTKIKKAAPSNVPEHRDIRRFFGNAATCQLKRVTKNSKEVETIRID